MKRRITRSFVPNLLTIANLFSGFAAIVYTSNGEFEKAAVFILLGAFFDMMDGVMARLIGASSEFGGELDSLCDVVTFGIAPSYLLYQVYFVNFSEAGIFFASIPAIMGALRLARFNVQLSSFEDKKYFTGFPIPSSAITIAAYLIYFHLNPDFNESYKAPLAFIVTFLCSLAMVSNIRFRNMPRPSFANIKQKPIFYLYLIASVFAIIYTKGWFLFPFMMIYLLSSTIIHIIKLLRSDLLENTLEEFSETDYID